MFAGLRRIAWLAAGIAALVVPLIMAPTTASAAGRTTTAAPAPPTAHELAAAHASASGHRRIVVKTTDRRPGGKLEVDLDWWGRGPYQGRIFGSVQDLEADGFCVMAYAWEEGHGRLILNAHRQWACPAPDIKGVNFTFKNTWRVLVQVCLAKIDKYHIRYDKYCSPWK